MWDRPEPGSYYYNYSSGYCKFVRTVRLPLSQHRPREIERESKILLVFSYSRWVSWLCLSWAKHAKPDKYNVAAELTYTSSDQMSGDNTRSFCSSGFRQQTWWCAAVQCWSWWRCWRCWRYVQGTKQYGRLPLAILGRKDIFWHNHFGFF